MSNRGKKHAHTHAHSETIFNGLLGPLTILAGPQFDVETASRMPYIFATLPNGHAVCLDDIHFGDAAGMRDGYPIGNPREYQQEIPGSLFFGLKAGDTILVIAMQDAETPENCYEAHVLWTIVNGIARPTQGPAAHEKKEEQEKPALVS
jgi:hypothetical protein